MAYDSWKYPKLLREFSKVDVNQFLMWLLATHPEQMEDFLLLYHNPKEYIEGLILNGASAITCVKAYRSTTGSTIREAKAFYDMVKKELIDRGAIAKPIPNIWE